jgi:predicted TIM-barrel fold metal-dependent hydrolase
MNRRKFLLRTSVTLAASSLGAAESARLTDCHVYLGSHPFRRLDGEDSAAFAENLRQRGVTEAWVGAFEGLLRRDVTDVNRLTAERCKSDAIFRPCGAVNLTLPAWQDDVKRCAEDHGMRVIRLHPNYHGHTLEVSAFRELLALATKHRLLVQVVTQMEDERTQNPQVRVPPVDLKPLPDLMKEMPDVRVMVLNANASMVLRHLQDCPNTTLDFAMIEGVGSVENLLKIWPLERLVFGSFAPVFYWESARLKVQESALDTAQAAAIHWGNASALLG